MVIITHREKQCLFLAACGKTSKEMTAILGISERTVDFHMKNAAIKLSAKNRQEAIAIAISEGVLNYRYFIRNYKSKKELLKKLKRQQSLKKASRTPKPKSCKKLERQIKKLKFKNKYLLLEFI